MGCKRVKPTDAVLSQKPTKEEVKLAAMAWAEFLYDEYRLEKQNKLLLSEKRTKMEKLTNHGKLNA